MLKNITKDIYYVGVNDHSIDLFEGQYVVPNGMAYNSYVIIDDKITVMDTVDARFFKEWLANVKEVLDGRKPTYLVVQHMEPDHSANILNFIKEYPDVIVVGNSKTFKMMDQFFHILFTNTLCVDDSMSLSLGHHNLTFVFAPMVHWPEVMVTYDSFDKVLFSADGFGKFGALDVEEEWACEARRYYFGIVGKYGAQVQILLKKAANLDIKTICPLHGPILKDDLNKYLSLYDTWSSYQYETDGICIFYTSVYGNTKAAVLELEEQLKRNGAPKVVVNDLARSDMAECVEDAFRYNKIVLATTTYNASIFPFMNEFIEHLVERGYKNKTIGFIENGSWAPMAHRVMRSKLEKLQNIRYIDPVVSILSSMNDDNREQIKYLAENLCEEYKALQQNKVELDPKALFNIGYGLYVVTAKDGDKDNGCIVNTVTQLTDKPYRVAININKANLTHDMVKKTGRLNVNVLSEETPFKVFQHFGFQSGRNVNKFEDCKNILRSENGIIFLSKYINSFMSLEVTDYVDLGTHGMFICSLKEARVISKVPTMTYTYYQNNVKPKPEVKKTSWVCKVCGYVYEGEELPDDFICPLCKHGKDDFEKVN